MHLALIVAVVALVCGCDFNDVDPKVSKQAQSAIDANNPDMCDALSATSDVEWCLNKFSETLNNTAGCKNIVNKTASNFCIKNVAYTTGNWQFCDDLPSLTEQVKCKAAVATMNVMRGSKNESDQFATSRTTVETAESITTEESTEAVTTEESAQYTTTEESMQPTTTEAVRVGEIAIEGSSDFKAETEKALALLKTTSDYSEVSDNIGKIQEFEHSGMDVYADVPTFQVGKDTWSGDTIWYASTIAHDSCHSRLYAEAKKANGGNEPNRDTWSGSKAETTCLKFQIKVLAEIGGDKGTINALQEEVENPHYQEVPYENRTW
jgi:hypothetical protein